MSDNPPEITLPLTDLLSLAVITEADVQDALAWWAEFASDEWKDALDNGAA